MTGRWIRPMQSRDPAESHRAATPLELFFDLCFVVAIALAASELHHGLAHGEIARSLQSYMLAFFAIWWAWMGFTWFASAYDTDDTPYRIKVFVQMTGVLVLAAGIPQVFDGTDFRIVTLGYVIMRVGLVAQWLRAAKADPSHRATAHRYAGGTTVLQLGWIGLLFVPGGWWAVGWTTLVVLELLVPIWAEQAGPTTWHPHHIAERYGLLTIIVLGESILASTMAIQAAIKTSEMTPALGGTIGGGLLILFSMWWLYFNEPAARHLTSMRATFAWGYVHLAVFMSIATVGAGLALQVDYVTHHAHISRFAAAAPVCVSVAVFVLLVWWLHQRPKGSDALETAAYVVTALAVFAAALTPWAIPATGILTALLVAFQIRHDHAGRSGLSP